MSEIITEGTTFLIPLPLPADSIAPATSQSSSSHINRSTRVGYAAGVDGPSAANSASLAYSGRLITSKGICRAAVGIGSCPVAAGRIVAGGAGGTTRVPSEVPGKRGMETVGIEVGNDANGAAAARSIAASDTLDALWLRIDKGREVRTRGRLTTERSRRGSKAPMPSWTKLLD